MRKCNTKINHRKREKLHLDIILLVHRQLLCIEEDVVHHKEVQCIAVDLQAIGTVDATNVRVFVDLHVVGIRLCVVLERV